MTLWLLLLLRFTVGLGMGGSTAVIPPYISEISPVALRGRYGTFIQFGVTSGIVVAFVSGTIFASVFEDSLTKWRWMLGFGAVPSIIAMLLIRVLVESPRWLIRANRIDEAKQSLTRLSTTPLTEQQLNGMLDEIQSSFSVMRRSESLLAQLKQKPNRDALLVAVLVQFFQQMSGFNVLNYYSGIIFNEMGFTKIQSILASALSTIPQLIVLVFVARNLDHYGRRPVLLFSMGCLMVCMLAMAAVDMSTTSNDEDRAAKRARRWTSISAILAARCSFSMGLGPIPAIMSSEVLPNQLRSFGMGAASATLWLMNLTVTQGFLPLGALLGLGKVYLIFVVFLVVGALWVYFFVPETKGAKLEAARTTVQVISTSSSPEPIEPLLGHVRCATDRSERHDV